MDATENRDIWDNEETRKCINSGPDFSMKNLAVNVSILSSGRTSVSVTSELLYNIKQDYWHSTAKEQEWHSKAHDYQHQAHMVYLTMLSVAQTTQYNY